MTGELPTGRPNLHASAVSLRGRGVLVSGRSGSGKTRLALHLLRQARIDGHAADLVSDDQVLLSLDASGLLVAEGPAAIAGLVEIRGFGPLNVPAVPRCTVDLLVRLVPPADAQRMAPAAATVELLGCPVPLLELAERDAAGAAYAVNAFLFGAPW